MAIIQMKMPAILFHLRPAENIRHVNRSSATEAHASMTVTSGGKTSVSMSITRNAPVRSAISKIAIMYPGLRGNTVRFSFI